MGCGRSSSKQQRGAQVGDGQRGHAQCLPLQQVVWCLIHNKVRRNDNTDEKHIAKRQSPVGAVAGPFARTAAPKFELY